MVIYLDDELTQKIRAIQKKLFDLTGSKTCLDLWEPHITIGAGVEINNKDTNSFCEDIERAIKDFKPFKVELKNYGFMDDWMGGKLEGFTKYVVYINVIKNKELQNLFEAIKRVTDKRDLFYCPISLYKPSHLRI